MTRHRNQHIEVDLESEGITRASAGVRPSRNDHSRSGRNLENVLESTLTALDSSLQVHLIATFNLNTCQLEADAKEVLNRPELNEYDQIPVVDGSSIVGILERSSPIPSGRVSSYMRRLRDDFLVSADEPLTRFIPRLARDGYRLVVRGTAIRGIVTRSDLHKLPVRLVAFCLVTHLEILFAELIQHRCDTEEALLALLTSQRRKELQGYLKSLKQHRLDPPFLEVTGYLDKRDLVLHLYSEELGDDAPLFEREVDEIKELRNCVAHGATYADNDDDMRTFVCRLQQAQNWIDRLSSLLPASTHEPGA